jgi:RNA polymerase sigma factor (sigma-70 family)
LVSRKILQGASARTAEQAGALVVRTGTKPVPVSGSPNNEAPPAELLSSGPSRGREAGLEAEDVGPSQGAEAKLMTKPGIADEGRLEPARAGSPENDLKSASVATLVQKAGEADPGAWGELVSRFGAMIAATGRRYRLTAADVAELQQTTWLRLVENINRIEHPERVGGWLATTARRESLQLLRRASKYRSGADQMMANMADTHVPDPDARPIAEERGAVLKVAWERLNPRCQRLLSLLISDDALGYRELSKLLEMPVGSIGPTRARCLERLRRLVEEEGMTGEQCVGAC